MHRVDTSTAVTVQPAPDSTGTPGFFTKGDPAAGLPATIPGPDFFNMVQEEFAAVLEAFGVSPDQTKNDFGQLAAVLLANFANIAGNASQLFKAAPGVANDEVVTKGQAASPTDTGLIELATNIEVQAGADTSRAVTPAGLASFAKIHAANGYQTLPGGLIVQWGSSLPLSSTEDTTINLSVAFPNNFFAVFLTQGYTAGSGSVGYAAGNPLNNSQFVARASLTSNAYVFFAIGN
jgi:hypothetical protein